MSVMDDHNEGPRPERKLPPAGNGSLRGRPEQPVAVPSSVFVARRDPGAAPGTRRRGGEPAPIGEAPVPAVTVALEAGPFGGLADLDTFERDLAGLGAVTGVRLCEFGEGRAAFDVTVAGADAPLQRELRERFPNALVGLAGDGLRIDLEAGG
jgi:hypothetical protein